MGFVPATLGYQVSRVSIAPQSPFNISRCILLVKRINSNEQFNYFLHLLLFKDSNDFDITNIIILVTPITTIKYEI